MGNQGMMVYVTHDYNQQSLLSESCKREFFLCLLHLSFAQYFSTEEKYLL